MSEDVFAHAGLADTHADLMRNIVSLRVSQDLFDDLSDRPADWDAAIALEVATKPPAFTSAQPVLHRPFEEARWNDAIHYPFRHWMRSRYSDGSFGVWYGADSIETTVHETVHHWRSGFLQDAGFTRPGIRAERKLTSTQNNAPSALRANHSNVCAPAVRACPIFVTASASLKGATLALRSPTFIAHACSRSRPNISHMRWFTSSIFPLPAS